MSYQGATPTKFGRTYVREVTPPERLHLYAGGPLATVDHEPAVPVLDQEDLLAQGIDTSSLVSGAPKVDALGSCTCNAGTVSLLERRNAAGLATTDLSVQVGSTTVGWIIPNTNPDAVRAEEFAILLYHAVTSQTGDEDSEWPPTDCGSTGLYVCDELQRVGLISDHRVPVDTQALLSLLQTGTVIMGAPWFNAWMEPNAGGFVDGNGLHADWEQALISGVAGGHETCITAIESLNPVVLRVRNSWSSGWGDHGSYRIHLSTLAWLGGQADFKQFIV